MRETLIAEEPIVSFPVAALVKLVSGSCDGSNCDRYGIESFDPLEETLSRKTLDVGFTALVESMMEHGQRRPITVYFRGTRMLIGNGNHRLAAAVYLGWRTVKVQFSLSGKIFSSGNGAVCDDTASRLGNSTSDAFYATVLETVTSIRSDD